MRDAINLNNINNNANEYGIGGFNHLWIIKYQTWNLKQKQNRTHIVHSY